MSKFMWNCASVSLVLLVGVDRLSMNSRNATTVSANLALFDRRPTSLCLSTSISTRMSRDGGTLSLCDEGTWSSWRSCGVSLSTNRGFQESIQTVYGSYLLAWLLLVVGVGRCVCHALRSMCDCSLSVFEYTCLLGTGMQRFVRRTSGLVVSLNGPCYFWSPAMI